MTSEVKIDLYEVMARMLLGFGDSRATIPEDETPGSLAVRLRERLAQADPEYHDNLLSAAHAVTMYVVEEVMAAHNFECDQIGEVAGNA
jgi:hypothetical protein